MHRCVFCPSCRAVHRVSVTFGFRGGHAPAARKSARRKLGASDTMVVAVLGGGGLLALALGASVLPVVGLDPIVLCAVLSVSLGVPALGFGSLRRVPSRRRRAAFPSRTS